VEAPGESLKSIAVVILLWSLAPASALAQGAGAPPSAPPALDEKQLTGMRLFNQSCRVCHTPPQAGSAQYGPALSRDSLGGQEEALRAFIASGSPRMPGFRSYFRQDEMSALVAYLKTLPSAAARSSASD
jgi:mono/diheme cytochrome c family protein